MQCTVLIGIQARSGSNRLPRKAFEMIGGKMMLDRVIEACKSAAGHLTNRENLPARVAILTPEGDPIARAFADRCEILQGPLMDVLGRYQMAAERYGPTHVVRITGDCPMVPPYTITRLTLMAIKKGYDYFSNVDPRFRTAIDGTDVEVISQRLLKAAAAAASTPEDREHVTTWIRREAPTWVKTGFAITSFDMSDLKLSVDTPDDLERVRKATEAAENKLREARLVFGGAAVHRI